MNEENKSKIQREVNSRLKKIYNAITLNELESVKHFLGEEAYEQLKTKQQTAYNNHLEWIYEEVNVDSTIHKIIEEDNLYKIEIIATVKCLEYTRSFEGKIVSGTDQRRIEKQVSVMIQMKKNPENKLIYRCSGCGVTLNIDESGICPQCGRVIDGTDLDFMIESIR